MKTDGKMSYKDFVFPVVPYAIRISEKRNISNRIVPYGGSVVEDLGKTARVISGEGEFYGENCIGDFIRLKSVMAKGGGGMLYIPSQSPVYAVFESLELICSDSEDVVRYSFRFTESFEKSDCIERCIRGDGKSCLWDISYRYGIDIDSLVLMNPHIRRPDTEIKCSERINLC